METCFAVALKASDGFSRLWPTVAFAVASAGSFTLLSIGLRTLPVGSAYAVWTGTGAALTVLWGMATGAEPVTVLRLLFIAGIVGCVVGLKLVPARPAAERATPLAEATDLRG